MDDKMKPSIQLLEDKILQDPFFGEAVQFVLNKNGNITNKTILDVGCGSGQNSIYFALLGGKVLGIDKRRSCLTEAVRLSESYAVNNYCLFSRCRAEFLPIANESIDIIFSKSTIQYMDRKKVLCEYLRIIKPGGIVILIENKPLNPFINIFRLHRKLFKNTPDEISYKNSIKGYLASSEVKKFSENFKYTEVRDYHLFRMITIYLRLKFNDCILSRKIDRFFGMADNYIFKLMPFSKRFSWFVALHCEEKNV